jgi:hypothetical protein
MKKSSSLIAKTLALATLADSSQVVAVIARMTMK